VGDAISDEGVVVVDVAVAVEVVVVVVVVVVDDMVELAVAKLGLGLLGFADGKRLPRRIKRPVPTTSPASLRTTTSRIGGRFSPAKW